MYPGALMPAKDSTRVGLIVIVSLWAVAGVSFGQPAADAPAGEAEAVSTLLMSAEPSRVEQGLQAVRGLLQSDPRQAVERLNGGWMEALVRARRLAEVEEFTVAGIIANPRDSWPVQQLQRWRVQGFAHAGKPKEALAAAKAMFNVTGLAGASHDLQVIAERLRDAYPQDPGIVNRFKLQQLAGAQADEKERARALREAGEPILAKIEVDPKPFGRAIEARRNMTDFDGLYGTGNLLLLSGRVKEAREVFEKAYEIAPQGEIAYVSDAMAKLIKAEDGTIGRANAWVLSIRPKE